MCPTNGTIYYVSGWNFEQSFDSARNTKISLSTLKLDRYHRRVDF